MTSVLVVREFDDFSRLLAERGHEVTNAPAVRTFETEGATGIPARVSEGRYDGYFITSRKAAVIFGRETEGLEVAGRVYVVGKSSFEILADKRLRLSFEASATNAREMIASIPESDLVGKRFLFVRGEKSLGVVKELVGAVATLDEIVVYATEDVAIDPSVAERRFDAAVFFSPSGVGSFVSQLGAGFLKRTRAVAIGATTAEALREAGIEPAFVSPRPEAARFAGEVAAFLRATTSF